MKYESQNLYLGERIVTGLFGVACFAIGLGILIGVVAENLYGYWRTRNGVTAEAQLRSVDSRTSNGGRGAVSTSTVVRYDYQVGAESFTGSRIAIFKQSGDFYERLSSAFHSGTRIRVFIDPQDPEFAVIDRDFEWWPFIVAVPFSLIFTVLGYRSLRDSFRRVETPYYWGR